MNLAIYGRIGRSARNDKSNIFVDYTYCHTNMFESLPHTCCVA